MADDQKPRKAWVTPPWVEGHVEKYLHDPENAVLWDAAQAGAEGMKETLLLTTIGRKSGEPRHSPLLYRQDGDNYVIIASKGGFHSHPAWYLNLLAHPDVEIRVGPKILKARARTVEGEDRARLWALMSHDYQPFNDYQSRADRYDREIPVILLEPVG